MSILEKIKAIEKEFEAVIAECGSLEEVEAVKVKFLGRKAELTGVLKSVASLPADEKKQAGKAANLLRGKISSALEDLKEGMSARSAGNAGELDVTLPGTSLSPGALHPLTQVMDRINDIFISMGFSIAEGPEIETEFYNFEALNIPLDHPSRDAFDTFYVEGKYLLRSHTSNVQIHVMQAERPPLQVIMPGRVYRPDAVDASHCFMFHQVEGLMVGRDIKFSDLKGTLSSFCRAMFGEDIKTRLRPHFFPFTEPSAEVDITCIICRGNGCRVCKHSGWLEILGAGMVDPTVFKAVGYDPEEYTGFAFGMGVERIAMLVYGIDDIRFFYDNDIRFLRQFI
ncbi:MAG: phenylalanine--tRNA ligase subunit alpha [Candidatus Omnitrophota bacterium]